MTPFEEYRALKTLGKVGMAFWMLHVRKIAVRFGFPPGEGFASWTDQACYDWVAEAFAHRGREFIARIHALAVDDESYRKVVRRSIKNEFIDGAKSTPRGKLRSRMSTLLVKHEDILDATDIYAGTPAWTIAENGIAVWQGDWRDLMQYPKGFEPIVALNEQGPTSAENEAKLVGAARMILAGARGALTAQTLATVLVEVFEIEQIDQYFLGDDQVPTTRNILEVVDKIADHESGRLLVSQEVDAELQEHAVKFLDALSDDEKDELAMVDPEVSRELAAAVRRVVRRLKTPEQAVKLAITMCARDRGAA